MNRASSAPVLASIVKRQAIILLLVIAGQVSCNPSGAPAQPSAGSSTLGFHIVLDEEDCHADCEVLEFESVQLGKMVLRVRSQPDVVLTGEDLYAIVPTRLTGVSADDPQMFVWSAMLKLRPEASKRIRSLGKGLAPQDQILISSGGEPLDVSYARVVGQMMSVGEFSSRNELVETLGGYAVVEAGGDEEVEVFSPEELAAKRERSESLERSEKLLREMEQVRQSAAEGRISHDEMVKRLDELRQETSITDPRASP